MSNLPYEDVIEKKIDEIANSNSNIVSHLTKYNNEDDMLEITLCYRDFTVEMKYNDYMSQGYTFMENFESGSCLVTKFVFPFSKIPYSIYDVHNAVEDEIFVTYDFHCLYNEKDIENAFNTIIDFINRNESRISSINDSSSRKELLEKSFTNAISVAAKKLDLTDFDDDLQGSIMTLDDKLYTLRMGETAFTDFITKGKVNALQRFYTVHSKKNELLTYEERYLEHLYKNDFKNTNTEFENEIKERAKVSKGMSRTTTIIGLISLFLAIVFSIFSSDIISDKIFEQYVVLNDIEIRVIPIALLSVGFGCFVGSIYSLLFDKKAKKDSSKKDIVKAISIFSIIGVIFIGIGTGVQYLYAQRNIAIGSNDIYICTGLHTPKTYNFDESKLYLVNDIEADDQYAVVVINNDYNDYYMTDCFGDETNETKNAVTSCPSYSGSFNSIEEFEKNFDIK